MADYFTPNPNLTYTNITGPRQGVTAGPLRPNSSIPQNTYYAPTSAPVQNNTPNLSLRDQMMKGLIPWNDNLLNAGNGSSGPSQDDLMNEINAGVNTQKGLLDEYAKYLQGPDYQAGQYEISRNYDSANKQIQGTITDADTLAQSDLDKLGQSQRSAYDEAIRSANALRQQVMSRFGGASSAGAAGLDVANMEFYRQQGGINQAYANQQGDVLARKAQAHSWASQKFDELANMKLSAMADLKKSLNDRLQEINLKKGELEAVKSQQRLAVMQDAINQTRAIHLADDQFKKNIQAAYAEKLINAGADYKTIQDQFSIDTTGKPYQAYAINPATYGQGLVNTNQQTTPVVNRALAYKPNDEFSNPFFS